MKAPNPQDRRFELLLAVFFGLLVYPAGYFWANHFSIGRDAAILQMSLDRAWPCVPGWIFVYSLAHPLCAAPVLLLREPGQLRTVLAGFAFLVTAALGAFLVYPVRMLRPVLPAQAFGASMLAWTWQVDPPYNCFPSLHVAADVFVALCCLRVNRLAGLAVGFLAVLVSLSTLFVKQHYLADILAGLGLALVSLRFAESRPVLRWFGGELLGAGRVPSESATASATGESAQLPAGG